MVKIPGFNFISTKPDRGLPKKLVFCLRIKKELPDVMGSSFEK